MTTIHVRLDPASLEAVQRIRRHAGDGLSISATIRLALDDYAKRGAKLLSPETRAALHAVRRPGCGARSGR